MDLVKIMKISAAGMKAQGTRLRIVAENLANSETLANRPGAEPYRRKTVAFKSEFDRALGLTMVRAAKPGVDRGDLERRYDPKHPAADPEGYVLLPNVNPLIEMMDMREAQRSYEANLGMIDVAKSMLMRTVDLLRA